MLTFGRRFAELGPYYDFDGPRLQLAVALLTALESLEQAALGGQQQKQQPQHQSQ